MRISGIIPARFASSRFPGKPLIDLEGKTMIQRVYEQAAASGVFSELIVATDDTRVADAVKRFGGTVAMTSPDLASGTDRCAAVATELTDTDVVINIQGDEPLLEPQQIAALAQLFEQMPDLSIGSLAQQLADSTDLQNPNVVKVVLDYQGFALYFSRQAIPFVRGADPDAWLTMGTFYKHIGMYGFRREVLLKISRLPQSPYEKLEQLEQLRWLQQGWRIQMAITNFDTIGVDTPEDAEKVRSLLRG
ncbi:MAG: 3-deoxy-manno-octulosonate cytidylyltransferase [Saprospiraceae bacterium]|jgi:3-deoxy-manno-octulosonate cytidylyltransferase (CMP-KDO synthetase)|nr:3-deoxy-manno-octulosonate cytidylyltransferase [Saprospiraceae bacterium]MDP4999086.1 3-deoxy-manno-octulosonate cytidylyltransferase [Saprospiraceae bacterium]